MGPKIDSLKISHKTLLLVLSSDLICMYLRVRASGDRQTDKRTDTFRHRLASRTA